MIVLGLSAFYHDSAAALVRDGIIVGAAQEERFTRRKHDAAFPANALRYCLRQAGIGAAEIDHVAFYDKPFLKFERLLETYLAFAPRGFQSFCRAMPVWLKEKLFLKRLLVNELSAIDAAVDWDSRLLFGEHHLSHAASAFYPSPFEEAAVLTLDGVGEWATTSLAIGRGKRLEIVREIHFPHSLGLLYSAFTYHLGFKVNSGEYKVMGLAPYGRPLYAQTIRERLIDIKEDGSYRLDLRYFDYCTGLTMTNRAFADLFDCAVRPPESAIAQIHMDLAASVQQVTEEVVLKLARSIATTTGMRNLCMAGGVALNCVANGKIAEDGCFEHLWIQPAAGDAGAALGAALAAYHGYAGQPRPASSGGDGMAGSLLGPSFCQAEIESRLTAVGARFVVLEQPQLLTACADDLAAGRALGWFQGRMEFGPRALGARSILADPRSPSMQSQLNLKVKYRESFRPFAPSVLAEAAADWFDLQVPSPYMLLVAAVKEEHRVSVYNLPEQVAGIERIQARHSSIPAVTHVDFSARVQTVDAQVHPRFHALLTAFAERTGCPVLVNTSFNVRGEPMVCTPEDAFRCFMGTGIESLAIGNCYLEKRAQQPSLVNSYNEQLEPD